MRRLNDKVAMRADVTDRQDVQAVVDRVVRQFGRIDVLVNNAGWDKASPFVASEPADWDRAIAVNLYGAELEGKAMRISEYERLRFERRDHGVLLITMDRADKYNAADEQMHSELARVWADVSADPETRVAVITGAGRAFSAGGDLDMVRRMAGHHDRVAHMLSEMSDMVYNMINCEKPIVSAINGVAVGAGTVVALLADISICALDARLGDGHVKLGVSAGDHAAILWPLLCGMAKARYYLLTGEMITGEEAERLGMVSKAVPRDEVLGEALRVADGLATGSQLAIRWTKRSLNNWLKMAGPIFDQSAAYEMLCFMGPDVLEGAAALTEKRAPRFPSAGEADLPGSWVLCTGNGPRR